MSDHGIVYREQVRHGLQRLGVERGSSVFVHSSLSAFGQVVGGAEAVAAAVIDAVGPDGLVIMPVYAWSEDDAGDLLRHPRETAKVTTGAVPAAFALRPDIFLADHPIYAFAYYGRDARMLASACECLMFPYGSDHSPYCLMNRRGLIVQLGVDDVTNTSIHVAEEIADPPYLAEKKSQSTLTVDEFFRMSVEDRRESLAHHRAGPRRDFRKATALIEQAGIRRRTRIGAADVAATDFAGQCRVLIEAVRREPDLLVV